MQPGSAALPSRPASSARTRRGRPGMSFGCWLWQFAPAAATPPPYPTQSLELPIEPLRLPGHLNDKLRLAVGVGDPVVRRSRREVIFEALVRPGYLRVCDQVVTEQQSV